MATVTTGDPTIPVYGLAPGEVFTVHRLLKGDEADEADFRSNFHEGRRPRKVEREWTVVWMAISTWSTLEQAERLAEAVPQIGATHVAELTLRHGNGFNLAPTGNIKGHYSIWGDPAKLSAAVADIVPIGTN